VDGLSGDYFTVSTGSTNGTATIVGATGVWTYAPSTNYSGVDSFTVTVTDDGGSTTTQVVNISAADSTIAQIDTANTNSDATITATIARGSATGMAADLVNVAVTDVITFETYSTDIAAVDLNALVLKVDNFTFATSNNLTITGLDGLTVAATEKTDTFVFAAADTSVTLSGLLVGDVLDLASDTDANLDTVMSGSLAAVAADGDWFYADTTFTYWDSAGTQQAVTIDSSLSLATTGSDDVVTIGS